MWVYWQFRCSSVLLTNSMYSLTMRQPYSPDANYSVLSSFISSFVIRVVPKTWPSASLECEPVTVRFWVWRVIPLFYSPIALYLKNIVWSISTSETSENIFFQVFISLFVYFGVYIYVQYFFDVVKIKIQAKNIY